VKFRRSIGRHPLFLVEHSRGAESQNMEYFQHVRSVNHLQSAKNGGVVVRCSRRRHKPKMAEVVRAHILSRRNSAKPILQATVILSPPKIMSSGDTIQGVRTRGFWPIMWH
jgi:hypothetical protein